MESYKEGLQKWLQQLKVQLKGIKRKQGKAGLRYAKALTQTVTTLWTQLISHQYRSGVPPLKSKELCSGKTSVNETIIKPNADLFHLRRKRGPFVWVYSYFRKGL